MPGLPLPPGIKFQPTDKELVLIYLSTNSAAGVIKFSDEVYKKPPSEYCTDFTAMYGHDNIARHYFFTKLSRVHQNVDRKVGSLGYWHGNSTKNIVDNDGVIIGFKRSLKFIPVEGECKGTKPTEWIMHEFSLRLPENERTDQVLCVIQNKKKEEEKGSGSRLVLDFDWDSGSGNGRSLKVTSVEPFVNSADPGPPRSCFDNPDMSDGVDIIPRSDAEIWNGELNDHLAVATDPQFDRTSVLLSTATTANANSCPVQDEEIQQSMNMLSSPQFDDDQTNLNQDAPIFSPGNSIYDGIIFL